MILQIDMGNSRIKWRLCNESGKVEGGSGAAVDDWAWLVRVPSVVPQSIQVASVRGAAENERFACFCREQWSITPVFAESRTQCAGVTNGYRDPAQLGVDRWLALLAARERSRAPAVVVSCGTALTVDLLAGDGRHLGGYIGPGLTTMRTALGQRTQAPTVGAPAEGAIASLAPGRDTRAAVDAALPAMMLGPVERALAYLPDESLPVVWLTGGDAPVLTGWLDGAQEVPDLVFEGLALALTAS